MKIYFYFIAVTLTFFFYSNTFAETEEIRLATQPEGHQLSAESIPSVKCALESMGRSYTIFQGPWERAQRETKEGTFDGFFIATRNDKRDEYAVMAEPFYSIKWLWVIKKDANISPNEEIFFTNNVFAGDIGSARLIWLQKKHKEGKITEEIVTVNQPEQILKMLMTDRVDVGLLNDHYWDRTIKKLSINKDNFKIFIMRDTPASVYFNRKFLSKNPDFLDQFNKSIRKCQK